MGLAGKPAGEINPPTPLTLLLLHECSPQAGSGWLFSVPRTAAQFYVMDQDKQQQPSFMSWTRTNNSGPVLCHGPGQTTAAQFYVMDQDKQRRPSFMSWTRTNNSSPVLCHGPGQTTAAQFYVMDQDKQQRPSFMSWTRTNNRAGIGGLNFF